MSDIAKKLIQRPESYSPKKPTILSMAEAASNPDHKLIYTKTKNIIDNVIPWNNPWVGCCEYIKCFTSMLLKIEYDRYKDRLLLCWGDPKVIERCNNCGKCDISRDTMLAHRERIYKSFLPIAGNGLTNAFDPNGYINQSNYISDGNINQSYYILDSFIERSFAYAGYAYEKIDNKGDNKIKILNMLIENIDKDIPVLCFFENSWQIITGYDLENDTITLCKGNEIGNIVKEEWFKKVNFILPITGKAESKVSVKDILKNIIKIMEINNFNGIPAGFTAYEECINFLSDNDYFSKVDDETLTKNYQELHNYIGYHAEARGFCGDGYKMIIENEHPDEELYQLLLKLSDMGWTHHNISWDGWNALKPWPCNAKENAHLLREKAVRDIIIDSVERMRENDKELIRTINAFLEADDSPMH